MLAKAKTKRCEFVPEDSVCGFFFSFFLPTGTNFDLQNSGLSAARRGGESGAFVAPRGKHMSSAGESCSAFSEPVAFKTATWFACVKTGGRVV